jgi:hypothetical protein
MPLWLTNLAKATSNEGRALVALNPGRIMKLIPVTIAELDGAASQRISPASVVTVPSVTCLTWVGADSFMQSRP